MESYLNSISLLGDIPEKKELEMAKNFGFIIFVNLMFYTVFSAEAGTPSAPINLHIITETTISGSIFRGDDTTKATRSVTVEAYETSNPTPIASFTTQTGFYTLSVPVGFIGTIKPTSTDVIFSPASIEFPQNTSDHYSNNNFAALYSIYVSKGGNDSNAGIGASPFLNIQAASGVVYPGDSVYIKSGTYTATSMICGSPGCKDAENTPVLKITRDGTQSRPILFEAFSHDIVTIDCRGINKTGVSIEADYITVSKLIATNCRGAGIRIFSNWRTTGTAQPIWGPPIFSGVSTGRKVTGSKISECITHNNSLVKSSFSAGIRVFGQVDNCIIEYSVSYQNTQGIEFRERDAILYHRDYSIVANRAPWPDAPRNCIVRNNITYDNKLSDENSDGIAGRYPTNMVFENNISYNNSDDNFDSVGAVSTKFVGNVAFNANPDATIEGDGNGIKICTRKGGGNLIKNNISFLNPRAAFDDDDGTDNTYQNNTAYKNYWGFLIESDVGGAMEIQNNLSYLNSYTDLTLSRGGCGFLPPQAPSLTNYNYVSDGVPPYDPCNNRTLYGDTNSMSNIVTSYGLTAVGPPLFMAPINNITDLDLSGVALVKPGEIRSLVDNILNQIRSAFTLQAASPLVDKGIDIAQPFVGTNPDIGAVESH